MLACVLLVLAVPQTLVSRSRPSLPFDTPPAALKPGEFIWSPQAAPIGPLVMVISLDEQLAYVYRNGLRIGVSTVSTGKPGKETPTGVFTILQKKKEHRSNLYDDAPMPFMQRLTWDGVALHAGNLPGYPASHGCVRLPYEFARQLYEVTTFGMTVVIAASAGQESQLAHPGLFAPRAPDANIVTQPVPRLYWFQSYRWEPEKSAAGPLTILVSSTDRLVVVIRNGIEIGRARISLLGDEAFGTQAYVMLAASHDSPSLALTGRPRLNWQAIALPGYSGDSALPPPPEAARRIVADPEFSRLVYEQMQPGTTLVLTDAPLLGRNTGENLTVITADDQPDAAATPRPQH